jgi:nucleoside-diphosphate-sugar epimerase
LLHTNNHELFLLVRPESRKKVSQLFLDLPGLHFIEGDITNTDVLFDIKASHQINEIDTLLHMAALYDLEASFSECYVLNVLGTQNLIKLANKMDKLSYFHYFSTYAVNPKLSGTVKEGDLTIDGNFPNHYSKSKNDAEHLVRRLVSTKIKTVIHRPGIIVGDSKTGVMDKIDGPYYIFDMLKRLKKELPIASKIPYIPLPLKDKSSLPLLPVDILSHWSAAIIENPPTKAMSCYHLLPSEVIWTKSFLKESLRLFGFSGKILSTTTILPFRLIFPVLRLPSSLIFYMQQSAHFSREELIKDYPQFQAPSLESYLPALLNGYLKDRP